MVLTWGYVGVARASLEPAAPSGASVLSSQSVLVTQAQNAADTTALDITGPGELFLTLTDLQFPTSFSSLQYAVSDAAATLVKSTAAGTLTMLDLTTPTTLYVNVFATVGAGGAGLYNLTATFMSTAVPLPASALSFIGGALLLGACRLRRSARDQADAPSDLAGDRAWSAAKRV
jgi:hypothetical protein